MARIPNSRRAFDWDAADKVQPSTSFTGDQRRQVAPEERANQLFGLHQKLIETRKASDALRRGEFAVLGTHNSDNTISYRRWIEGDARDVVVALNNDVVDRDVTVPAAFAPDGTTYVDSLSGAKHVVKDGTIVLDDLHGNWGAVLLRETAEAATS